MFNDLFMKSIKPEINIKDRISRDFSERNLQSFLPKNPKEVQLYNDRAVHSIFNEELKFTNYISSHISSDIQIRITELSENLNIIRNFDLDPVNFNNSRITDIIALCVEGFNPEELEDDSIMKVSLKDSFGENNGVRVYLIINNHLDLIEILLIDPFHLLIPSKHRVKRGRSRGKFYTSQEMLEKNFRENRNNDISLAQMFNLVEA